MTDDYVKRDKIYKEYFDLLVKELDKNINSFLVGTKQSKTIEDFQVASLLMQMRNQSYASARPSKLMVDTLRDKMLCVGVNTVAMENIFPASYDDDCNTDCICSDSTKETDEANVPSDYGDGIGFMIITNETASLDEPIFRIKN